MEAVPRMSALEWGLLILLSLIWGGSFFFAKAALAELGPFSIVLGRVAIGALALLSIARLMGQVMPRDPDLWRDFAIMGVLNNVIPFSLIFWGQQEIASGLAATLNATTPFFAIAVGKILNPEARVRPSQISGNALGIIGVAALIGIDAFRNLGQVMAGQIAVLTAALSYGFAGHFGRRFRALPPIVPATGQVTCSAIIMLPIALVIETPWRGEMPGAITWAYLAGLGVLCTAAAYLIFFRLLASAGAVNLLLVTILIPPSAIVLGFLFLGERLQAGDFVGLGLIAAGLLVIDGRVLFWFTRASPSGAR